MRVVISIRKKGFERFVRSVKKAEAGAMVSATRTIKIATIGLVRFVAIIGYATYASSTK
jgi:hypothetical protein